MATHWDTNAVEAIRSIKMAINEADQALERAGLQLAKVELALATALTKEAGAEFKIKIVGFEAHRSRAETQTLTLDLTPTAEAPLEKLGVSLADELTEAIVATAAAMAEAADGEPRFDLDQAAVALQIEISNDGKVAVFVEGSGKTASTNTLTITLKPKQ